MSGSADTKAPLADVLFVVRQQHWDEARATAPARTGLAKGCCLLPAWPALAGTLATAIASHADARRASAAAGEGDGAERDALPLAQSLLLFPIEVHGSARRLHQRCACMFAEHAVSESHTPTYKMSDRGYQAHNLSWVTIVDGICEPSF